MILAFFLLLCGLVYSTSKKILFNKVSRICASYLYPINCQEESIGAENELLLRLKNKPLSLMKNVILLEYMRRKQNLLRPLELFDDPEKLFLGISYKDLRRPRKAIEYYEQALKTAQVMLSKQDEGIAFGALGMVYSCLGEYRKTIEYHEQALKIF